MAYFSGCPEVKAFFQAAPQLDKVKVLGLAVFEVEGGYLDRVLTWDWAEELRRRSYNAQYVRAGLNASQTAQLRLLIRQNRDRINVARRRIHR